MFCVAGADGFFGTYYIQMLLKNTDERIVALNHSSPVFPDSERIINADFELSDSGSIKNAARVLRDYEDIKILFLAAVHNPDIVSCDPERAEYINTVCYESFLESIKDADVRRLIYASSDTVYGESRDGLVFSETSPLSPVNIYGRQKAMAEEITLRHGFTVARYSYMCGPSPVKRKKHFYDTVKSALVNGERFFLLSDWNRHALSYTTAAEITYRLFGIGDKHRIVNVCADKVLSKYEIGLKIAEHNSLDNRLLIPVSKDKLGIFKEHRADTILMDNSLLKSLIGEDSTELIF